jgi:RHS repeat-associated protein
VTSYGYDDATRMVSRTDRNGDVTTYRYDPDGRPLEIQMPGRDVRTEYDGLGRATTATVDGIVTRMSYDGRSLLDSVETTGTGLPDMRFSYTRDASGMLTATDGVAGRTVVGYDPNGLPSSVTDPFGGRFGFSRDAAGRQTAMSRPNGVTDTVTWDAAGNLASRLEVTNGQRVTGATYDYDAAGRRVGMTDDSGAHTFGFDPAGNLTSADHPAGFSVADESFTYDVMGNRTSWRGNAASTVSYDAGNRLTRDASFDYAYDSEGNLIRKSERSTGRVTTFVWSADHTLSSVSGPAGRTTYRYDALGRRVQSTGPGGKVTTWAYDGSDVAGVYTGTGAQAALERTFATAPDGRVLSQRDAQTLRVSYPVLDGLGSVTGLLDADGNLTAQTQYGAFGDAHAVAPTSGSTVGAGDAYGYTGHAYDPGTDLVYARGRYYDPAVGRFLSQDPVASANPYAYAGNRPMDLVDPSGAMAVEYSIQSQEGTEMAIADAEGVAQIEGAAFSNSMGLARGGLDPVLKGQAGVDGIVNALENAGYQTYTEVTMQSTTSAMRTRIDIFVRGPNGEQFFIEVKNGASAALTRNQRMLYPALENGAGLIARGANAVKAGLIAGDTYILPGWVIWL